jgi:hypothetical protein
MNNKLLGTAVLAASLATAFHSASAADMAKEARNVDANVSRVRVSGVVDLRVKQGATPSLVVWGDNGYLADVKTSQNGDTLQIDTKRDFSMKWESHRLRVDLTVPNLSEVVSQGVGSTDISGFAGDSIRLALDGAGPVALNAGYRNIDARLGGAGSLTINGANADRVELKLGGAGHMQVRGQAKTLRAHLSGVGSLDAQELRAENVDVDLSGLGSANVFAKSSANVSLSGLGSANVYGNPATRNASASGLGKVHWQ